MRETDLRRSVHMHHVVVFDALKVVLVPVMKPQSCLSEIQSSHTVPACSCLLVVLNVFSCAWCSCQQGDKREMERLFEGCNLKLSCKHTIFLLLLEPRRRLPSSLSSLLLLCSPVSFQLLCTSLKYGSQNACTFFISLSQFTNLSPAENLWDVVDPEILIKMFHWVIKYFFFSVSCILFLSKSKPNIWEY